LGRILIQGLRIVKLFKNFLSFYGSPIFINVFTNGHYWTESLAKSSHPFTNGHYWTESLAKSSHPFTDGHYWTESLAKFSHPFTDGHYWTESLAKSSHPFTRPLSLIFSSRGAAAQREVSRSHKMTHHSR